MHDDRALVEARLERELDKRIRPAIHETVRQLDVTAWNTLGPDEPVPPSAALRADYEPFPVGGEWGPAWGTVWFHFTCEVASAVRIELRPFQILTLRLATTP